MEAPAARAPLMRYLPDAEQVAVMPADQLRSRFLVQGAFQPDVVALYHIDLDRVVLGGAVPARAPLQLEAPESIRSQYFLERREVGILNVGAPGRICVDGSDHALANRDVLYVGRGAREVILASDRSDDPARFYIVSYPAQAAFPTQRLARANAEVVELGDAEHANRRRLVKYVHAGGIQSAQLVMGVTELLAGSVWNTMPPHTHLRRTEVYLYFDLPPDAAVFHLLGEPERVRTIVARDLEIALSPGWSIHAGCGTTHYAFCWAMGGENQDFTDMQPSAIGSLR